MATQNTWSAAESLIIGLMTLTRRWHVCTMRGRLREEPVILDLPEDATETVLMISGTGGPDPSHSTPAVASQ